MTKKITVNLPTDMRKIVRCSACGQDHKELPFESEENVINGEKYNLKAECPTAKIPIYAREITTLQVVHEPVTAGGSYTDQLDGLAGKILARAMIEHQWNVTQASPALGMSRQNLHTLLKRHGIRKPE